MSVFIEPPFWALGYPRRPYPHVTSVLVTAPVLEPLTVAQGKLRAGLEWADGDPRDALMTGFIAAARAKVEKDTGLALLTQTHDVYFDALPGDVFALPFRPIASVTSVKTTDTAGVVNTLNPTNYVLDAGAVEAIAARLSLSEAGVWPTDLQAFRPWVVRIVAGFTTVELLTAAAPLLIHAVGLLVAHYATAGRDLTTTDGSELVPYGYEDAIAPYQLVTVA